MIVRTIKFVRNVPVSETMHFEDLFEEPLQFSLEEKKETLQNTIAVWLFVNGAIAGEIYGHPHKLIDEEVEDVDMTDEDSIYCSSTAILPEFRGLGLAKLLKAYWLGIVSRDFKFVTGHATSDAMKEINRLFGAEFGPAHAGWYGTDRTAYFYRIKL